MIGRHQVEYGTTTIEFDVMYADRKTLGINVHPDQSVTVIAPQETAIEEIMSRVRKRAAWIVRQQREFATYADAPPKRQYVSGETWRYLGRQYRLKVTQDEVERVRLSRGFIHVHLPDKSNHKHVKHSLEKWYRGHARRVFQQRLDVCYPRVARLDVPYPKLMMQQMKTRWGSCTPAGKIILNTTLIQTPKPCIDYVILHELCHLREHHHGAAFYALLDQVLPDWRERKNQLEHAEVSPMF